jgi:predicted nucleic acid-binding Zn ribbon protein
MTIADRHTFDTCSAMTEDAMSADTTCSAMMKKMGLSSADMKTAKSCMAMSDDAMMKDQGCATMMKAHPQIFSHKGGAY